MYRREIKRNEKETKENVENTSNSRLLYIYIHTPRDIKQSVCIYVYHTCIWKKSHASVLFFQDVHRLLNEKKDWKTELKKKRNDKRRKQRKK